LLSYANLGKKYNVINGTTISLIVQKSVTDGGETNSWLKVPDCMDTDFFFVFTNLKKKIIRAGFPAHS
jgi:hypothetical protein